jgi:hypothetical protein
MRLRVNAYLKDYNRMQLFPRNYIHPRVEASVQKYERLHVFPLFKIHMFPFLNVNAKVSEYRAKHNRLQLYLEKAPALSDIRAMFVH